MAANRSYADRCPVSRALDVVGERWALLVVRELLLGPQRFSDLRRALPRASSNLVADRLRELGDAGVLARRRLAPPAGSWVYELTARGRELEPVVAALGHWGSGLPQPPPPVSLSPTSALLYLRGSVPAAPWPDGVTCRLDVDAGVWTATNGTGRLDVRVGEPPAADAALQCDAATIVDLVDDPDAFDAALISGRAVVTGDPAVPRRLFAAERPGPRRP
jgi:DNA-binding HxlR family transcriptional regulator